MTAPATTGTSVLAWIVAGLAGASLLFALVYDAARRSKLAARTTKPSTRQSQGAAVSAAATANATANHR